jgi:hypothetical protein
MRKSTWERKDAQRRCLGMDEEKYLEEEGCTKGWRVGVMVGGGA